MFKKFRYFNYDLYVFTWKTLEENFSDLKILNEKKKKIVFLFLGSEIRWIEVFRQQYPDNSYKGLTNEEWQSKIVLSRNAELYCSSIFAVPDAAGLLIRGYYHMFMPLNISAIKYNPQCRDIPLMIHAPSKRDVKGTSIILDALDQLRQEGIEFVFELIEGLPNELLIKKLEDVDIVIDQLFANGPGTLATEAMAAGCAVAARFLKELPLTGDVPMCYIDENCVLEQLRFLITNLDYRRGLVDKSRNYVETYNDSRVIAEKILKSIGRDKNDDFDYRSTFFRDTFKLPDEYVYPEEIIHYTKLVLEKNN